MRRSPLSVAALLLSLPIAVMLTGCLGQSQTPPLPEQNAVLVYPTLPPTKCLRIPTPVPSLTATDNEWALWKKQMDDAGADCRDKLDAVDDVVSKWPKSTAGRELNAATRPTN